MFKKILGSNKEQKEKNFFQEKSNFSAIPKLLDESETKNSTELWLRKNYPLGQRNQIKFLEISSRELCGLLDLTDFINLEELYCYDNQLSGIKFADSIFSKLRVLHVGNNHFPPQDLSLFSRFTELEVLNIENNNFTGSLKILKNLVNLKSLDISDTNIESGLIHLSNQLESLFCRAEKEVKCQKISEELKDYELGHDCYDFQAWKEEENWLIMPGSWPKNRANKERKFLETEPLNQEKNLLTLINRIYQQLILIEEKNVAASLEKDIKEFHNKIKKRQKEVIRDDEFENESEFNFNGLALVAEKYLLAGQKIRVLEEEIKKLKQNNSLLAEKNEFGKFLQLELIKQNEEVIINKKLKNDLLLEIDDNNYKSKNNINKNKITNNMTNNTNNKNEKIFILEWSNAELKDGTMRYENFKVVAGSEKENLLFYSTFFVDEFKFKKGEIYQLSTPGNFVEDTSGTIPGGFDASGIIQEIDSGGYEFEKVAPSLLIKELWEEKEENAEKLNLTEKDLEQKKKDNTKINQELLEARREFSELQNKFSNLQLEKDEQTKELSSLKENLKNEKEDVEKKKQELVNSEKKNKQLQDQFDNLQEEKNRMEAEWVSPEGKKQYQQEKDNLNNKLKRERKEKQKLIDILENLRSQGLNDNIQNRLEEKKKEQEQLRITAESKLGNQAHLLENLLEKQENFDLAVFEDVNQNSKTFLRAQDKLQDAKDKLICKLSTGEIEELCQVQTEISKLEMQQKQWKEMEEKQAKEEQFETFIETPPVTPKK
ncbi:MAG: hypothetical protein I3275_04040 [Candidatus Moeniiplasma glomeromycotorum]|nr:hypothetical protein [Candidatus Moeniiplasma glomeromycotorum]